MIKNPKTSQGQFAKAYFDTIRETVEHKKACMSSHVLPHDDYAQLVGYVNALEESLDSFEALFHTFFPAT